MLDERNGYQPSVELQKFLAKYFAPSSVTLQRKVVGCACSITVVHIKNIILHRSCTRKYISTAAQRIKQRMTHINFRGGIKHKCINYTAQPKLFCLALFMITIMLFLLLFLAFFRYPSNIFLKKRNLLRDRLSLKLL